MNILACTTIKGDCWQDDNLIKPTEFNNLSEESKRNLIAFEKKYHKFCK
jgi:hypothetical protein